MQRIILDFFVILLMRSKNEPSYTCNHKYQYNPISIYSISKRHKCHKQVPMSLLINCTLWYFSFLNMYKEKKRGYQDDDDTIIQEISARLSMRESFEFVLYCINDF